jgi:hypothetical protein
MNKIDFEGLDSFLKNVDDVGKRVFCLTNLKLSN